MTFTAHQGSVKRWKAARLREMTLVEIACICLIVRLFVFLAKHPLVWRLQWCLVLLYSRFSLEGGAVSKFLKASPFALLGTLSYSIYMTHAPVESGCGTFFNSPKKHVRASSFSARSESAQRCGRAIFLMLLQWPWLWAYHISLITLSSSRAGGSHESLLTQFFLFRRNLVRQYVRSHYTMTIRYGLIIRSVWSK